MATPPTEEKALAETKQFKLSARKRQLVQFATLLKMLNRTREKKQKPSLLDLPLDVILEIFDYLHPMNSACLGLACKDLYPIHWALHPKLSLETSTVSTVWARWVAPFSSKRKHILAGLLIDWAKPLIWSIEEDERDPKYKKGSKFVSKERHRELIAQGQKRFRFRI